MTIKIEQITELQAIAQSGLAYCVDKFDIQRYKRILEIAVELMASYSSYSSEEILESFKIDNGYCTPKVDTRGAVFKRGKILLVKEKSNGLWSLPGGWADVNYSPKQNVLKEIQEEAGFCCKVIKLIGVFDKRKSNVEVKEWPHVYKLFFLCEILSCHTSNLDENEILDFDFFDHNHIPPLSIGRTNPEQINLCFKHFKDKLLPPEID